MRNWLIILLAFLMAAPVGMAQTVRDDDEKDPSIRPEIRRLHPERERAKAIKKLQEQMSQKADPNADPWDTSDDMWGTVDLPPNTARDSAAVEGRRLTGEIGDDESGRRLVWRDEPVTVSMDQLMPFMDLVDGEYRSRYVDGDSVGNEAYFAFDWGEDSICGPLRLCLRYSGDSPCDYDQVTFTVDGYDYSFYPLEQRHGAINGVYWSASDDELNPAYRDLVYALTHGEWVMIKLQDSGGISRVKVLNEGQLEDFANTLALYRLLGGEI